jgi:hypothetical protein
VKFVPAIVTIVPPVTLVGANAVIVGRGEEMGTRLQHSAHPAAS